MNRFLNKSIKEQFIKYEQQKEYYRKVLEIIIDIVQTLGRQGLAFREHETDSEDHNGNFHYMVNLVARYSATIKKIDF